MGQTTVGAFTCVRGRALFKKLATGTDRANLLRIAHKGRVTKLAALFALVGGGDKGADVVNRSPKLINIHSSCTQLQIQTPPGKL